VSLSLQDILTPLLQFSSQPHVAQAAAANPELQQHTTQLTDLARQLRDIVDRLNAIDPSLLATGRPTGPSSPAQPGNPPDR
jgi:hypothetical protein